VIVFVHVCVCVLLNVILHVADADCIDNKANVMIAATPKTVTPKLHSSKLLLSTASVRVRRYVCRVKLLVH